MIKIARPPKNLNALSAAYTKEEKDKRIAAENKLKGKNDNIRPPDFLKTDIVALNKFEELVKALEEAEILSNVDVDLLAVYCDSWSKYVKATKILSSQDMVEDQINSLNHVNKTMNPYIKVQQTYSQQLIKISSLFGLSPADRSKVSHNIEVEDKSSDVLLELIKGLGNKK